jgi:hypothetical protein
LDNGVETPLFADLDPPQTFALRADKILGNERQIVWRWRASVASDLQLDLACGPRNMLQTCRVGLRDPYLTIAPSHHRASAILE